MRTIRNLAYLLGASALLSSTAFGANAPAATATTAAPATALRPSPLTAEQIIEKNVEARGGLSAWRAVQTLTMVGMMDAGPAKIPAAEYQPASQQLAKAENRAMARAALEEQRRNEGKPMKMVQLPFAMEQKRGRKQRVELEFQGQKAVQTYDGAHGWKLRPFLGRNEAEPFNADEEKVAAQAQDLDGPLIDYKSKGTRVAVEGIEPVEGRDAYNLRLTLANGTTRHVWVDATSFLEVKIDGTRRLDGKQVPLATFIRDYRSVNGLKVPFLTETQVSGVKYSEKVQIEKVSLNTPLDDARFGKPQ